MKSLESLYFETEELIDEYREGVTLAFEKADETDETSDYLLAQFLAVKENQQINRRLLIEILKRLMSEE